MEEKPHLMQDLSRPRTPAQYLRLFLTGFAMGAADIVPGVSGGTMAFILGVYETLINAIKSFNLAAARLALKFRLAELLEHIPLRFLIALGLGILTAIFALSNLLGSLLETQPLYVFTFFGGLIVASILTIGLRIRWTAAALAALAGGALAAFWIVGLPALQEAGHDPLTLLLSGMVAICAMILPGISGSFILLILGQYEFVLGAVRGLDFVSIGAVAVGAVIGLLGFSRILSWLLSHYENVTIAALVGFMLGSLRRIWEEMAAGAAKIPDFGASEALLALALGLLAFLLVNLLDHLQTGDNVVFRMLWRSKTQGAPAA